MISRQHAQGLISDMFEEIALVVGGLESTRQLDDDLVWSLVRSLDGIRQKTLLRLDVGKKVDLDGPGVNETARPHPAVEDLLRKIRQG